VTDFQRTVDCLIEHKCLQLSGHVTPISADVGRWLQVATRSGALRVTGARWLVEWTSTTVDLTTGRAAVSKCSVWQCAPSCAPCTAFV